MSSDTVMNTTGSSQGAPVDAEGQPIFHRLPQSFESAGSDGERWRWLLARAMVLNPNLKSNLSTTPWRLFYNSNSVSRHWLLTVRSMAAADPATPKRIKAALTRSIP